MKLTKEWLIEKGIRLIQENDNDYHVYRKSKKWVNEHKLKIHDYVKHHKYGKDKVYKIVGFSDEKSYTITLQRLVYAWFIGDIDEGYDVDHIDDDSLNNRIDNLQLLTRTENLRKRKDNGINQYRYLKGENNESK